MHDRSPQKPRNHQRSRATARHQIVAQLDPGAATPSTRFNPRSFVPALWGLALVGTLAACATGPSVAHETAISTAATPAPVATPTTVATPAPVATHAPVATPTTVATPRTVATPTSVATPTTVATRAPVGAPTVVARSSAVVDEFAIVDGAHMHIRGVGSGATTVVLIGEFNDGGDNWGTIEAALAEDSRVCSSARFGTGTSDPPPAVQTFTS